MIRSCIVLGGGIAGLTLADNLSEKGISVTLVERNSFFGGLCRRIEIDGSKVDFGPHNLRTNDKSLFQLWMELTGGAILEKEIKAQLYFNGSLITYPVNPIEVLQRLGWRQALKCGVDLFFSKIKMEWMPSEPKNYEEWAIASYGKALYELFFHPMTAKVWGVAPKELDVQFARDRLPPLSIRRLIGIKEGNIQHREFPGWAPNYYPTHGVYSLVEGLIRRLESRGVPLLLNTEVTAISPNTGTAQVTVHSKEGSQVLEADYVASSLPLPTLLTLTGLSEPKTKEDYAFRGIAILYLSVPENCQLKANYIYCADPNAPFNRLTDFGKCSREICAPGKNVIAVEAHHLNDQEIPTLVQYLWEKQLLPKDEVFATRIERENFVYPLYVSGYKKRLEKAYRLLSHRLNLITFGRQGLFSHVNTDQAMSCALKCAQYLCDKENPAAYYDRLSHPEPA